jgi:hypothetical protein
MEIDRSAGKGIIWYNMNRRDLALTRGFIFGLLSVLMFTATAQSPVIVNEFMARNSRTLADEDGDYSDWIELRNVSTVDVNLEGWFLTDARANLTKWQLPAVTLSAGGYLVVFASGKDRALAGSELHTNFALDGGGEYLALVRPDGLTIASEFTPGYPEQFSDVAYGNGEHIETTSLIQAGDQVRFLVPNDDALERDWTSLAFNDAE